MNFKLCPGDPLVDTLRTVFKANIIRIPRNRIQPLTVLARKGKQLQVLGQLQEMLADEEPLDLQPEQAPVSPIEGNRSSAVDFGFGVKILEGYLKGFGMPAAGVSQAFSKVKSVRFGFEAMQEVFISPLHIGRKLTDRKINMRNPALQVFLQDEDYELLIVDTVYASQSFTLHLEGETSNDLKIDLPSLEGVVTAEDVGTKMQWKNERVLEFKGPEMLSFAFSCVRMYLDKEGACISAINPHKDYMVLERTMPEKQTLGEEPAMIDLED